MIGSPVGLDLVGPSGMVHLLSGQLIFQLQLPDPLLLDSERLADARLAALFCVTSQMVDFHLWQSPGKLDCSTRG